LKARPAKQEEIEFLQQKINESTNEKVNLSQMLVWVAEEKGKPVGLLSARLIFQVEPMYIFEDVPVNSRRRAAFLLAREMESFIGDRAKNKTGIYSYFAVMKDKVFETLAQRWGLLNVYRDCRVYGRDL
jgi:hypothetical protein